MPALWLLMIQFGLSLTVFGLIAVWWVAPRLSALPKPEALLPLLVVNVFRFVPLALFAPGQADPAIPAYAIQTIAFGDFAAGLLALLAAVALRLRWSAGLALTGLFSVVGFADIVTALGAGLASGIYRYSLGFSWFILVLYVPVVVVSQLVIGWLLWRRSRPAAD